MSIATATVVGRRWVTILAEEAGDPRFIL